MRLAVGTAGEITDPHDPDPRAHPGCAGLPAGGAHRHGTARAGNRHAPHHSAHPFRVLQPNQNWNPAEISRLLSWVSCSFWERGSPMMRFQSAAYSSLRGKPSLKISPRPGVVRRGGKLGGTWIVSGSLGVTMLGLGTVTQSRLL